MGEMSQIIADHSRLSPPWVAHRASRAASGRVVRYRRTKGGRMVNTALHVAHCMRQMVRPPKRTRTSWEWRVRHPPPLHVGLCVSWKPIDRTKAKTNSTNALVLPRRAKEVVSSWKSMVMVRFARIGLAVWPMSHLHADGHWCGRDIVRGTS